MTDQELFKAAAKIAVKMCNPVYRVAWAPAGNVTTVAEVEAAGGHLTAYTPCTRLEAGMSAANLNRDSRGQFGTYTVVVAERNSN